MEQRGTTVAPLTDQDDLRQLVSRPAPFLTAYVPFRPASGPVADEVGRRWRVQRQRLAEAGADESRLAAVDEMLDRADLDADGLAIVVPGEGDPVVERLAGPLADAALWGRVPALRPLVAGRQGHPAHVVALVDRTGADLWAWRGGEAGDHDLEATVTGDEIHLRKVGRGGWSHRRIQQRAEDTWQYNMGLVAGEVTRLAERVGARVVAVGGDERAVGLLLDAVPVAVRERVQRIGATRAADGSGDRLDDEVAAELDAWVADRIAAALALHAEESGQDDRATVGAGRTLEALRAARVATLLVVASDGTDDDRDAWVGATVDQVATSPGDLADGDTAVTAPLLDAAVAAALASGADVVVVPREEDGAVPPALRDGLGALLRW